MKRKLFRASEQRKLNKNNLVSCLLLRVYCRAIDMNENLIIIHLSEK